MKGTKFVKAKCTKTGIYYGLEVKQFGSTYKVMDMFTLSPEEARVTSSDVRQDYFKTNKNLLACSKCGSRRVGGCGCAKTKRKCSPHMKYQFDCIYCKDFEIDYSVPTSADVRGREGETITLSQGQEVKIRFSDGRPLNRILVGVGWDPLSDYDSNMDVDSSVVLLSPRNKEHDLVFFGNLQHPSGSVIHHGDNVTGIDDDTSSEDDENITVYLDKVPVNRDKLVFVLNIYSCDYRHQTLDSVKNLYIKLYDPDSKKPLIQYQATGDMRRDTAIVIGMAYKSGTSWSFKAIGKSLRVSDVDELARVCKNYI